MKRLTKLKYYRLLKGLSQSELASQSGVSLRFIQACEQQYRNIYNSKISTLLKLCNCLDIKIDDLFSDL